MSYTKVFGDQTLPPSQAGFASYAMTQDEWFVWPYNAGDASFVISAIMEISCALGNVLNLPDATQVSVGEDFLIRNTGSFVLVVKDNSGTSVGFVSPGQAVYFYLTDNSTAHGTYSSVAFGVGASAIDAAALAGSGLKAIQSTLNQNHAFTTFSSDRSIAPSDLAVLLVFEGGNATLSLPDASTTDFGGFFFLLRNSGSGMLTITPDGTDTIDLNASAQMQPGESMIVCCSGTNQWFTIGYGRSMYYQFTQLVKDVSAGGTISLTAEEAGHKLLTFTGNPAAAVTVIAPTVVGVYYTQSAISTAQTITLKTAAGTGVGITQNQRIIAICDGTDIVAAQTISSNTQVTLIDGVAASPALSFASSANTGLYKHGSYGVSWSSNGVELLHFDPTGSYLKSGMLFDGTVWCDDLYANGNVAITGTVSALGATTLANGSTAVTQSGSDNSTKVATTAFVQTAAFSSSLPSQAGHTDQLITTNGTAASWSALGLANQLLKVKSDGSGVEGSYIGSARQRLRVNDTADAIIGDDNEITINLTIKTGNYYASEGDTFMQDTSGGGFTLTLPGLPFVWHHAILIRDAAGTFKNNNLTLAYNGNKIEGALEDFIVDIDCFSGWITWSGPTYGWIFL